ncbi:hypothetical protein LOK49_LG13G01797 [Camellia lanceoleosa]|uniref:Uncharacterized protein n=1 Tax=Camellia lanceoleosa TaxID=1840588 RepID=A0ACC0FJM9_9ERIC|nr:hypothetical protein LOK49_LG13G01797 [Camellia lanceoleosa]
MVTHSAEQSFEESCEEGRKHPLFYHDQDAIGCLVSITDSSVTKSIFISSLERFQLINDLGEFGKQGSYISASVNQEQGNITPSEKGTKRVISKVVPYNSLEYLEDA